ncbi:glycosyltransferase family 1 protein [Candidatus Parcubacteria bacterium]|jgi:glycosyltransferase involved in cell wall biosynthesis|nr:MAG: glycosyltransferase family 1 protein [Candidatus Parcubacteria bacterium]
MRIGIDARFYGSIGKGLGRYTERLITYLEKIARHEFVIFLRKENYDEYQPSAKNFTKQLADFQWYTFEEQRKFPALLRANHLDLIHYPHFNVPFFSPKPFVVTIHDLILTHFPTRRATTLGPIKYWFKQLAYRMVLSRAVQKAERILTVSNFTQKDIQKYFGYDPRKIVVAYEAVDGFPQTQVPDDEILRKYYIQKPYLLYVGNAYPHKNLEKLIEFFKALPPNYRNLKMVIVCKPDYFLNNLVSQLKASGLENRFIFTGFVPDAELGALYQHAHAFIFPSLYEGFGLPPLEALALGVPVLSSNKASLPEVLGGAVTYFDPLDVNGMIEALLTLDRDQNYRQIMIAKGLTQVKKYNWLEMAKTTLATYEAVVKAQKI